MRSDIVINYIYFFSLFKSYSISCKTLIYVCLCGYRYDRAIIENININIPINIAKSSNLGIYLAGSDGKNKKKVRVEVKAIFMAF